MSSQADLDAVNVESLKNSGGSVDVLGVPFCSPDSKVLSSNARLENAAFNKQSKCIRCRNTLQQSFDRNIFDAGVSGLGWHWELLPLLMFGKHFDAYDNLPVKTVRQHESSMVGS